MAFIILLKLWHPAIPSYMASFFLILILVKSSFCGIRWPKISILYLPDGRSFSSNSVFVRNFASAPPCFYLDFGAQKTPWRMLALSCLHIRQARKSPKKVPGKKFASAPPCSGSRFWRLQNSVGVLCRRLSRARPILCIICYRSAEKDYYRLPFLGCPPP